MSELDTGGCRMLIQAVIVTACNDYREALKRLAGRPGNARAAGQVFEIEAFFRGGMVRGDLQPGRGGADRGAEKRMRLPGRQA